MAKTKKKKKGKEREEGRGSTAKPRTIAASLITKPFRETSCVFDQRPDESPAAVISEKLFGRTKSGRCHFRRLFRPDESPAAVTSEDFLAGRSPAAVTSETLWLDESRPLSFPKTFRPDESPAAVISEDFWPGESR